MTDDQGTAAPNDADAGMRVDDPDAPPTHARTDDAPTRPVREWGPGGHAETTAPPSGSGDATSAAAPATTTTSPTAAATATSPTGPATATAATAATTGAGSAPGSPATATTVLPTERRPQRPGAPREPRAGAAAPRSAPRPAGRGRRARLVLQRVDPWSVFLFSLVASLCLGVVLLVAVAALYLALDVLGVLSSVNGVLGEVVGSDGEVGAPLFTAGRVMGAAAVLAAVDVVLITALATLSALLYNLCASLTGGIEVVLGERD